MYIAEVIPVWKNMINIIYYRMLPEFICIYYILLFKFYKNYVLLSGEYFLLILTNLKGLRFVSTSFN